MVKYDDAVESALADEARGRSLACHTMPQPLFAGTVADGVDLIEDGVSRSFRKFLAALDRDLADL